MEKLFFRIMQSILAHIGVRCCHFLMRLYLVLLDLVLSYLQNHCKLICILLRSMHMGCWFFLDFGLINICCFPSSFLLLFRSNMLRLTMSSRYQFHSWFTYSMLLSFLFTAGFWVIKLIAGTNLMCCSLDLSMHCDVYIFPPLI